ncbi:MAG: hypothetical protein K2Q13_03180 [Nitrosomonas sp.]|uniref:hypothetical protein n=1 Tax=Nitrosomonas sp. TaxID=42353 RepID=UPI0025FB7FB1|nr:hypothetical protein [Nitrosomonas sp.]MBY0474048.1 hypothetical protein [Nitrosomonas sp.]
MKMKIQFVVLLLITLLFIASIAYAQNKNSSADNRNAIDQMTKELGLNETQRGEVETILNTEQKKVEAVFNEERKKLQLIQEETRSNLQAVLTPEQMQKLENKMRQDGSKNNAQKK